MQERLIILAVDAHSLAAGVRGESDRFFEKQALAGHGEIDAAEAYFARDAMMIADRVVAEERKVEAVVAARRAVATAGIAAGSHQYRFDIEPKTNRRLVAGVFHRHRHLGHLAGMFHPERRRAIG